MEDSNRELPSHPLQAGLDETIITFVDIVTKINLCYESFLVSYFHDLRDSTQAQKPPVAVEIYEADRVNVAQLSNGFNSTNIAVPLTVSTHSASTRRVAGMSRHLGLWCRTKTSSVRGRFLGTATQVEHSYVSTYILGAVIV